MPAQAALPRIRGALRGLRALVQRESTTEVWRTLALAEEALLHYPAAVAALQKALALSQQHGRKDLKRLAQLREYAAKWDALGLTPHALEALGRYLGHKLAEEPCDHTHRHTEAWLDANGIKSSIRHTESAGLPVASLAAAASGSYPPKMEVLIPTQAANLPPPRLPFS